MDRPLLAENFSAAESLDAWSGRSLHDWNTFRDGGLRLVEYLHYVGYNGLMISVAADGSAIYPSATLEPTPRYDTGVFFGTGPGPGAEGRAGDVVAAVRSRGLATDSVDRVRRAAAGIGSPPPRRRRRQRTGSNGSVRRGCLAAELRPAARPGPVLQHAWTRACRRRCCAVVREFADRYAPHRSLAGLALRLSAYGYAQLPGPDWGMDDGTIARFQRDTRLQVPGEGPNASPPGPPSSTATSIAPQWLRWRADQLHQFYRRVAADVGRRAQRGTALPGRGRNVLRHRKSRPNCAPSCRPETPWSNRSSHAGIDLRQYQDDRGHRAAAAGTDRARRAARRPGGRPGNRPDARRRPLLPQPSLPRQPLLPSARRKSASPRSISRARSNRLYTWLTDAGGAVGSARTGGDSSTASRPWIRKSSSTAAGCCRWARKNRCATWWRSIAGCRPCGLRRRATDQGDAALAAGDVPLCLLPRPDLRLRRQRRPLRGRRPQVQARSRRGLPTPSPGRPAAGRLAAARTPTASSGRSNWGPTSWRRRCFPSRTRSCTIRKSPSARGVESALALQHPPTGRPGGGACGRPRPLQVLDNPELRTARHCRRSRARLGHLPPARREPCNSMSRRNTAAAAPCTSPATGRSPAWSAVGSSRRPRDDFPCRSGSAWPTPASQPPLRLALEGKLDGRDYYRFAAIGQPQAAASRRAHRRPVAAIHLPGRRPAAGRALRACTSASI